jgi:hypothetical protein
MSKLVVDETIVVSVLGLIYTVVVYKMAEMMNEDNNIQMMMFMLYTFGFIGIYAALTFFRNNRYIKNGLLVGSTIIVAHSTYINWHKFDTQAQCVVSVMAFIAACWIIRDYNKEEFVDDEEDTDTDASEEESEDSDE